MHERNIFKSQRPDFKELADEFPEEFGIYVQKVLNGKKDYKYFVNFKDPASLRALSKVLLKKYFDIKIDIPLDRLIPTIPLRLNYIHWIEDLVKDKPAYGIDIGCGASCVYGLLSYKLNGWEIYATEIDETSLQYAEKNIKLNKAEEFVKVVKSDPNGDIFTPVLTMKHTTTFNFSMCNPPFFDEMEPDTDNRTGHRPPPASLSTASENESFTEGGEVQFVTKMIKESLQHRGKIKWYTTMLGRKSSLKALKKVLTENNISVFQSRSFYQGRTTRWFLAWTFTEKVVVQPSLKPAKPFNLRVRDDFITSTHVDNKATSALWEIIKTVQNECNELEISLEDEPEHILLENKDAFEFIATASKDTWTGQRRKKRKQKQQQFQEEKQNQQQEERTSNEFTEEQHLSQNDETLIKKNEKENLGVRNLPEPVKKLAHSLDNITDYTTIPDNINDCTTNSEMNDENTTRSLKRSIKNEAEKIENKKPRLETVNFKFSCTVALEKQLNLPDTDGVVVSLLCLEGERSSFHDLCLYFKTKFNFTQILTKKKNDTAGKKNNRKKK